MNEGDEDRAHVGMVYASGGVDCATLVKGKKFPTEARRGCLLLGRDVATVARRCANGEIGFAITDGTAFGVDHCTMAAVVVF